MANTLKGHRAKFTGTGAELVTVVTDGAAANNDITVAGIKPGDVLVSVIEYDSGAPVDNLADTTITEAGKIQIDASTASNKVVVTFWSL